MEPVKASSEARLYALQAIHDFSSGYPDDNILSNMVEGNPFSHNSQNAESISSVNAPVLSNQLEAANKSAVVVPPRESSSTPLSEPANANLAGIAPYLEENLGNKTN